MDYFLSFGKSTSEGGIKNKRLAICLDISGSMESAIRFIQTILDEMHNVLTINGIKEIVCVAYSDYDIGSFLIKNNVVWFDNIKNDSTWRNLPKKVRDELENSVQNGSEKFIDKAKTLKVDDFLVDQWKIVISTSIVATDHKVVKGHVGTPKKISDWLRNRKAGELGSGGTAPEAAITAFWLAYHMFDLQPFHCIFITDAQPHYIDEKSNDAELERKTLMSMKLEYDFKKVIELANIKGCRLALMTNSYQWNHFDHHQIINPHVYIYPICFLANLTTILAEFIGVKEEGYQNSTILNSKENSTLIIDLIQPNTPYDVKLQYYNSVMRVLEKYPEYVTLLPGFISVSFFNAKKSLGENEIERWNTFCRNVSKNHPDLKTKLDTWIAERVSNTDELLELLKEFWNNIKSKKLSTDKVLIFNGEPFDKQTFFKIFGQYITSDDNKTLTKLMSQFKIVDNPGNFDEDKLLEVNYLPIEGLYNGPSKFIKLVWALAMGNQTLPMAFKPVCWLIANKGNLNIIPFLNEIVTRYFEESFKTTLDWLVNSNYKIKKDQDVIPNWWISPISINILQKVASSLPQLFPNNTNVRLDLLYNIALLQKRFNDQVNFEIILKKNQKVECAILRKCKAGYWVPETLFGEFGCVYCSYEHEERTEGGFINEHNGLTYHEDGTVDLVPDVIDNIDENKSLKFGEFMDMECSRCRKHYSVYDSRLGNAKPLCFNCRTGRRRGLKAPIVTCQKCGSEWVFGVEQDDWSCASCAYPNADNNVKTFKASRIELISELIKSNDSLMLMIASMYNLDAKLVSVLLNLHSNKINPFNDKFILQVFHDLPVNDSKKTKDFQLKLNEGVVLKVSENWPIDVPKKYNYDMEITNMDEITEMIGKIKYNRMRGICDLGTCDEKDYSIQNLYNPCGHCSFKACKNCLRQMFHIREGCIVSIARLLCPCSRGICKETLTKIGRPYHKVSLLAASSPPKHRIAICCGAPVNKNGYVTNMCSGKMIECLPPMKNGVCAPDNPDDDVDDYRCNVCRNNFEKWEVAQAKKKMEDETKKMEDEKKKMEDDKRKKDEQSVESLMKALPKGTILRKCPGCNEYAMRNPDGGSCAHMKCLKCMIHFCWICLEAFDTSSETYQHMDQKESEANDDGAHSDCYNVDNDTVLVPNNDDIVVL